MTQVAFSFPATFSNPPLTDTMRTDVLRFSVFADDSQVREDMNPDSQTTELVYYDDAEPPATGVLLLADEVIVEDNSEDEIPW